MSTSELEQVKLKERMEKGRQAAYDRNPVATYAVDQDSLAAYNRQKAETEQSNYNRKKDGLTRSDSQARLSLDRSKTIAKIIADLDASMTFPKDMTIEKKQEFAEQLLDSNLPAYSGYGAIGEDPDTEAVEIVNSFPG
jgi:hypothetical protein